MSGARWRANHEPSVAVAADLKIDLPYDEWYFFRAHCFALYTLKRKPAHRIAE